MPEELQSLLDRIQKDGVEKAETEADRIVSDAKLRAKAIVEEADANGRGIIEKAETNSKSFAERGKVSLEQAARDVILGVADSVSNALEAIAKDTVGSAMTTETLQQMLVKVVEQYCKGTGETRIDILLNEKDRKSVTEFLSSKYADALKNGLEVKADSSVVSGFKVSMVKDKLEHDFSVEAVTDSLCHLMRPHLAEVVRKASAKSS